MIWLFLIYLIVYFRFVNPAATFFSASVTPSSSTTPLSLSSTPTPHPEAILYLGSFGYSLANIDSAATTLYFDNTATAIIFPPDFDWQDASESVVTVKDKDYFASLSFNDFNGPYNDRRCLGANCLEQKGNDLFYNGRALPLPADIKVADIAAVSIGALTRRWLIGLTLKDGQNYRGRIFYFNGQKFIELITPEPIKSAYFGLFGFGGEEDDFLLIYGAYRGIAYRVRGDKLTDISKFFGIRLLGNGFKAEIIKAVYRNNVNWYIYSSTLDRPRLIKLWQNQTTEIVGETIPTDFLTGTEKSAAFKLLKAKADEIIILSNIKNNNREADWRIFTDRGFKNSQFAYLTTIPIMVGGQSQIIIKKIISSDLRLDSGSKSLVKFLFSEDGQKWRDVPLGEDLDFVTPRIGRYFLKVIFSALSDKFYSPFVGSILFDYDYQK